MRLLLVSDSHGRDRYLDQAIAASRPLDGLIHLGDSEERDSGLRRRACCPVYMVAGNCDYFTDLPRYLVVELASHRLFMTHGHHFHVTGGDYSLLAEQARRERCDIALFGHIHRPVMTIDEQGPEVMLLNPGSISFPRQEDRRPSYMLMELVPGKNPRVSLRFLGG